MSWRALFAVVLSTLPLHSKEIDGLPSPAAPRPLQIAEPEEKTLANGLRVLVVERPGLPLLSAEMVVRSGAEGDPPKLAGLTSLTAGLLTQGTATRSATEIAQQIEALGATVAGESGWDVTTVRLDTLAAQSGPAMEIFADVVRRPKFDPEEIDRLRRQTMDDLRVSLEQPGSVARSVARRVAFGDSPYGHPAGGTLASLPRIKRDEIVAQHARIFRPGNAVLLLAGRITPDEGFSLAEKAFGDWAAGGDKLPEPSVPVDMAGSPRAVLIDLPDAGQAAVYVTLTSPSRTVPDFVVGEVANTILGGGYSSRLNQEIRVKRGLSYGARSTLAAGRTTGLFTAACQTKNESADEVVGVVLDELKRLAAAPAPADFFSARQAVLRGDVARGLETNAGHVAMLAELAGAGLPVAALSGRAAAIEAVSSEQARAWAAAHLAAGSMHVVVAGRAKDVEPLLRMRFPQLQIIPLDRLDLESADLMDSGSN